MQGVCRLPGSTVRTQLSTAQRIAPRGVRPVPSQEREGKGRERVWEALSACC